jgi:hypothetical protein
MAGKSKVVQEATNKRTRELYAQGLGCRAIAKELGEDPVSTFKRLSRMGILRDKDAAYKAQHGVPKIEHPFRQECRDANLRTAAIGEAIRWFLGRGYTPSLPLEPARYDLVVESDQGFKRVQIKSTNSRSSYGMWSVSIGRNAYDSSALPLKTYGKRRKQCYTKDEIDLFFILTGDCKYLIPVEVVEGRKNLSLGKKYDFYKV